MSTHKMCEVTGIYYGSFEAFLKEDFWMRHASAKFIPWLLTQEYKENCFSVLSDLVMQKAITTLFSLIMSTVYKQMEIVPDTT